MFTGHLCRDPQPPTPCAEEITMSNHSFRGRAYVLAALASFTFGLAGSVASAADNDSKTVRFAELDLAKPAGAKELYERLKRATFEVCGGRDGVMHMYVRKPRCYDATLSAAVAKVNSPLLSA